MTRGRWPESDKDNLILINHHLFGNAWMGAMVHSSNPSDIGDKSLEES
jgi:hypothetical protein